MGLGMKKHPDKSRPAPALGWMNASIHRTRGQLQSLQDQVRTGAIKLAQKNAALIANETVSLARTVRRTQWPAAALICTSLFRLIQIQAEVERILSRYRNKGGRHNARRH